MLLNMLFFVYRLESELVKNTDNILMQFMTEVVCNKHRSQN